MIWRALLIAGLVAGLAGNSPAWAVDAAARARCLDPRNSPAQTVPSCTPVIDDAGEAETSRFAAYLMRGRAFFAEHDWERAIADYDSAIQLRPDAAEPYNGRGAAYDRKGDHTRAVLDYSEAIRRDPGFWLAYNNRALAYNKGGAHDLAIADFDKAIHLNPQYSTAYNGRGIAHSKKGDDRKAIADFAEAIRLNGSYAIAYNNRGIAYANIGAFDQAIADVQTALRLDERNPYFYNELAWTYFRAGRAPEGLPYAEQALRLNPDYANGYDTRAAIHEAMGENAKAIADLEKALALDPSRLRSAQALRRLGQSTPVPVALADVVRLVQEKGWQVDHKPLCAEFKLAQHPDSCTFKQVSVQELDGRGDPRAFNVPASSGGAIPYVLIFHLGPLVGEFFIASPEGELLKAFIRSKGTGYSQIPNDDVREEFNKDVAYWTDNFARLKQGLEAERSRRK
jgi:tetratricopeptide (TPR) repeat protein